MGRRGVVSKAVGSRRRDPCDFQIRSAASSVVRGARALHQDFEAGAFGWDVTRYGPVPGLALHF